MAMYQRSSIQDVLRCDLCEQPLFTMFCDICQIQLCKACVGEHLSDESKTHKVVQFRNRGSTPKCPKHSTKICELHCEGCDIPICATCVSCGEHEQHKKVDIIKTFENKKTLLQRDLQELEESISPEYQEIASDIPGQKVNLIKNSEIVIGDIDIYGDALHREIDIIINTMKSDLKETNEKYLSVLITQEHEIERSMSEIEKTINNLRELLDSNNIYLVSSYKSRNAEFRTLPPKLSISLASFMPSEINKPLICQQIGSLSASSIKAIERKYTMKCRTSPIRRPQNKNSTLKKRKFKPKQNPRANTVNPQRVPLAGRYVTSASLNIQERSTEYDDSN